MLLWRVVLIGFTFALLGYVVHVTGTELNVESYSQPLSKLTELANEEKLSLHEWQIRMRDERKEKITRKEFIKLTDSVAEKLNGWELTTVSNETEWKAHYTYTGQAMKESVQIFAYPISQTNEFTYVITYETVGTSASSLTTDTFEAVSLRTDTLGLGSADVYVQIQATKHNQGVDDMSNLDYANKWIALLNASPVEALIEDTFVSLSAYKPDWTPFIETNEKRMNVQVALREKGMGAGTTVTIGTPIITNEY
ncbi:hypothetical protein GN156_06315 [bacterium LRH843]|nr:hypothetical protein [bacterium LRH843]